MATESVKTLYGRCNGHGWRHDAQARDERNDKLAIRGGICTVTGQERFTTDFACPATPRDDAFLFVWPGGCSAALQRRSPVFLFAHTARRIDIDVLSNLTDYVIRAGGTECSMLVMNDASHVPWQTRPIPPEAISPRNAAFPFAEIFRWL